ncbi:MAG: M20/M25/M40 family metallo-hydrolase [Pseudomonadota bacterium]
MRIQIVLMAMLMGAMPAAMAGNGWITADEAAWRAMQGDAAIALRGSSPAGLYLLELDLDQVGRLAATLHGKLRHCGGFMLHESEDEARLALAGTGPQALPERARPSYRLTQQAVVAPALARIDAAKIAATIMRLSAFPNRYFSSAQGVEASDWIRLAWDEIGRQHPGFSVVQFAHAAYRQPSVIATILGSDRTDEVVVLGAHLDSISIAGSAAPGADDDASGIAGLTELLRTLVAGKIQPRRTIKLIAYAAEEVGLRGSQEIAKAFRQARVDVVGVLQLDMTNYKGSDKDIYLIDDHTDPAQNQFLRALAAAYLPALTVGSEKCGYACSDHASWTGQGYAASMPFESAMGQDNPHIHTRNDTFANSGSQAAHALKFTRLAAAFAIELAADSQ